MTMYLQLTTIWRNRRTSYNCLSIESVDSPFKRKAMKEPKLAQV